jgi:rhamnosyl/mannosyltransferase
MYEPDIGGVETTVKEYADFLKQYDDVVVLCINKRFSLKTDIENRNGVKVYRCASFGTYLSMPVSLIFFFYLYFLSRKADVIHIHEPFPLASMGSFLLPTNKKIFVTWHSDIIKQKAVKKIVDFFQKKLCKKANVIQATSDYLVSFSSVLPLFKQKVITIPSAINPALYQNIDLTNIHLPELPEDYVLFLGRFAYYKGLFVLLEAIENIKEDIPFVITGDGELKDEIRAKVEASKKNITLIDRFVTEDEKKFLLKNCKFLVFPSIYPSEAFGLLQLEAMIYGKPVINTNLPTGVPWVSLHNVSGLTVNPFDADALAKSIKILYTDTTLYGKLSTGAKKRVMENFTSDIVNMKLYNLYFGNQKSNALKGENV